MKNLHSRKNQEKSLELEKRKDLYLLVSRSPGLHFREIQRRTQSGTGQLDYHLEYLRKVGLIRAEKRGEYLRFYARTDIKSDEKRVLELLYKKNIRRILLYLLDHECCNHDGLVQNLEISPSTISWHLKKLIDAEMVNKVIDGRRSVYSLTDPDMVVNLFIQYQESFLDSIVDRFIEMWEP
jgi:predicted transcriptional regulator